MSIDSLDNGGSSGLSDAGYLITCEPATVGHRSPTIPQKLGKNKESKQNAK